MATLLERDRRPAAPVAPLAVDVFSWQLDAGPDEIARLRLLLSPDEHRRAANFAAAEESERFIAGRAHMRRILARYVRQSPHTLKFRYGPHGRPSLAIDGAPSFNLSHSSGVAVLAVARGCEVGIDIERIRPVPTAVAQRFFAANENAVLDRLHGADWLNAFFRCWTRKEAVVKSTGKGLCCPLGSFAVSLDTGEPARVLHIDGQRAAGRQWALADFALGPDLIGAVAARTMGNVVRLRHRSGAACWWL